MENFHKQQGKKPINSVDGMVGAGASRRTPSPTSTGSSRPSLIGSSTSRSERRQLNDFRATEGFRSIKQPAVHASSTPVAPAASQQLGRNPRRDASGSIDLSLPPAPTRARKRRSKLTGRKKVVIRSVAGVLVLGVILGGFLFTKGYLKLHQIFKGGAEGAAALQHNVDPTRLSGEGDGRVNILLLGKGGDGHEAPDLTDTLLIASIDPVQKKAALLSVPRDLWVNSGTGGSMKINAVYANAKYAAKNRDKSNEEAERAGTQAIEKVIEQNIGIPIHYYVMVDFSGFKQAIEAVGGVDINVSEDNTVYEVLYDHQARRQYVLDVKQGQQHFDGTRALFYSRSRQTSTRGDFDRTERQRLVIIALKEKILSLGTFSNPNKVSKLLDAFGDHISSNLSINEVMRVYDIGKTINSDAIASIGLADEKTSYVTTDNINGQSIVRPKAGLTDFTEIQNFVRNALRDGYLTKEDATVAVYNGTGTPGLAAKKGNELKSFGYTIGTVANAPTATYAKTIVVDLSGGQKKYTRNYLEKRFGVTAVTALPDASIAANGAQFVIIIGSDQQ